MARASDSDSSESGTSPALQKTESPVEGNDSLTDPQAFTGAPADLERAYTSGLDASGLEAGEDELSRYELSAQASRQLSRRLTGGDDLLAEANDTDEPLPVMGGGRDYPPPLGDRDIYSVAYDGPSDPIHPHNWKLSKKILICYVVGMLALSASVGSAIFAEATPEVMEIFGIGSTTATLGTSLYVFGFASGPIIWGPLSELYGRQVVLIPSCFGFICFSFAVATAKDIQTIMLCRFFAGFIGASPLVVAPAALADLFGAATRGQAMALFAMVLFGGPMLAPIFGGFIVKNPGLGWRWCLYISAFIGIVTFISLIFLYTETHHPLILVKKAETLRRRTGNWGIHAPHEEFSLSLKEIAEKNITRPLRMLFTEPILFLITLYNSFIYGLLYLFLTAVPLIFQGKYHWVSGVAELPYLSMLIGIFFGGLLCIFFERRYGKIMAEKGKPVPEERLPPMMIGGFVFAIGIFWMGWSGDFPDKVHWMVPTVGIAFIGFGLITIFLPCMNYIIDCYLFFAASALAGNTFMRSMFGGVFPLFARQMFVNMKIKWAGTLLGCVAVAMIPVPFLFYKYGVQLRTKSKYAFVLD